MKHYFQSPQMMKLSRFAGTSLAAMALAFAGPGNARDATTPVVPSVQPDQASASSDQPAASRPSILLIMTDDVGFGASSTFGGPVQTPTFTALAEQGLRYANMTTTGICSPTRAALLTGRNHNAINIGHTTDVPMPFEGFTSVIPKSAATGARLLRDAGYSTAMFGKAHITPQWETGPSGPFDRWPTGLGFQHFYGFLGGDTNQWAPSLYLDTSPVEVPEAKRGQLVDTLIADDAVDWMRRQQASAPGKPFFVYFSPGTAHAPHHAPPEWIARYKGKFDQGWDKLRAETLAKEIATGVVPKGTKLAARPDVLPAWDTLSAQQRRVYAREMEVYAAALSFADHEIGRVVEEARARSGGNLLVVYVQGDNGSSAEAGINGTLNEHGDIATGTHDTLDDIDAKLNELGGPNVLNHFSSGWAFAMNAPFPWFKQIASHYGATRNGVVISWPGHIAKPGGVRTQFHHITDVMPTLLEAAGVASPKTVDGVEQQPFDGVSLSYSFDAPTAPSKRTSQYYAIGERYAIYKDGWVAAVVPRLMPWDFGPGLYTPLKGERKWQLFNVAKDFSESADLAAQYPQKLEELQAAYQTEARRNNAIADRRVDWPGGKRPSNYTGIKHIEFVGPIKRIPEDAAPPISGRSFKITAKVTTGVKTDGAIWALGGRFGGMALYLEKGVPVFEYNFANRRRTRVMGDAPLTPGPHTIRLDFDRAEGWLASAKAQLSVDSKSVGAGTIAQTANVRISLDESFDVGSDTATPVSNTYSSPNAFPGKIESVVFDLP